MHVVSPGTVSPCTSPPAAASASCALAWVTALMAESRATCQWLTKSIWHDADIWQDADCLSYWPTYRAHLLTRSSKRDAD